jgi:hypothetical protein
MLRPLIREQDLRAADLVVPKKYIDKPKERGWKRILP